MQLMKVEVLMDLLEAKASNGTPTYSWWGNKVEFSLRCHDFEEELGSDFDFEAAHKLKMNFRNKYMSRAGLVNQVQAEFCRIIELDPKLFQCCAEPDIVCIDGIVISIEMQRLSAQRLSQPWLLGSGMAKRATTRPDRHVWKGDKIQRMDMLAYARTGIKADDFQNLLSVTESSPCLHDALVEFSIYDGLMYTCERELYYFFRSMGKDVMPATQFLPSMTWDSVSDYIAGRDDTGLAALLEMYAPVMSHVYYFGQAFVNQTDRFSVIKGLFQMILEKAKASYPEQDHLAVVRLVHTTQYSDAFDECLKTGVYFPNFPYHSGIYKVPVVSERSCQKYAKKNGRLGSGCLLYWCARHRLCIGWEMLLEGESPKQVYHTLSSRFPAMPKIIIYDNACNLAEYFYNRSPILCKATIFLSDGFHFCHHINCSHCFDSKKYKSLLHGISTVTHEQKNALLAKLKLTAPGMRYDTFVLLMTTMLAKMNYKEMGWRMAIENV